MCIAVQLKPRYVTCEYQARTTANHQHHPGCHISISFFGGIVALAELLCTPPSKTNMTMENHHVSIFLIGEYRGYIFNCFFSTVMLVFGNPPILSAPKAWKIHGTPNNTRVFYPTKTQRMVTQKRIYDVSEMCFLNPKSPVF